jgi:hypothetical protein
MKKCRKTIESILFSVGLSEYVHEEGKVIMDLQEIEVFIDKDGKVQVEVRGVKGESCLDLTKALEIALGGQIESREMTPEASDAQTSIEDQEQEKA